MVERAARYLEDNAGLIAARLFAAVAVFVLLAVATSLLGRLVARTLRHRGSRGETLAGILRSLISILGLGAAGVMALSQLGIDVATVLAGAGVIGLAVGFGAQTLVKDCISGFFLILDDVVQVGDLAQVDDKTGVVEHVGLRVTKLRAESGQLWYIPNGAIAKVGNFNRGWNRAEVKIALARKADLAAALDVLRGVGAAWAEENPELSTAPPSVEGVLELGGTSMTVRLVAKVPPQRMWGVELDLRRRAKEALDAAEVPTA